MRTLFLIVVLVLLFCCEIFALDFKSWVDSCKLANGQKLVYTQAENIKTAKMSFDTVATLWTIYNSIEIESYSVFVPASSSPAVVAPTIQDTALIQPEVIPDFELDSLLNSLDVLLWATDYDYLISLFSLQIGDTLQGNRDYNNIIVKGKNFSLTASEFDSLYNARKIKDLAKFIDNKKLWLRIASKSPTVKGGKMKIDKSRVAGFSEVRGLGSFFRVVFSGNGCKRTKR